MTNITFYTNSIKQHIVRNFIASSEIKYALGIKFIDSTTDINNLSDSYIYIGEGRDVEKIIKKYSGNSIITIFVSNSTSYLDTMNKPDTFNIIITDYNLITLYNYINSVMMKYHDWDHVITNTIYEEKELDYLLNTASNFLNAHVILFNAGYHVIDGIYKDSIVSKFATECAAQEYLCYHSVIDLEHALDKSDILPDEIFHFSPNDTHVHIYVKRIVHDDLVTNTLMIIRKDEETEYDISYMINYMAAIIKTFTQKTSDEIMSDSNRLSCLISDIHSRENISSFEIIDRLNNLTFKLKKYVRCIVVNFYNSPDSLPYNDIIRKISFIFTGCNIALYKKTIIILYSSEEKTFQIPDVLYNNDFNDLLEQYNALAVVSNSIHHYDKFRSLYYLCRRLSKILRNMTFNNPYGNVFPYDEYSTYVSIDFAAKQFQISLSSDDIVLLADPAIVSLNRYDKEHNSNLCEVLLNYLTTGRNITLTAKSLYMHRNTVQNKIAKISQLISLDLADGNVQQRLLYSCQIIKYYEEFIKEKLF